MKISLIGTERETAPYKDWKFRKEKIQFLLEVPVWFQILKNPS